jgi:DNA-binding NarL/FixJ family response regulator
MRHSQPHTHLVAAYTSPATSPTSPTSSGGAITAASTARPLWPQGPLRPLLQRRRPPTERDVLDLLVAGLSNPQICNRLFISDATAKTHVARILQKLGLRDRIQVVIYAYETGLIRPGAHRKDRHRTT